MPDASESKVYFFSTGVKIQLKSRKKLKRFIALIFKKEKKKLALINYIFCTDKSLLGINYQYLNHDTYTDVITFDLSDTPRKINAEIYISIDRVRENAKELDVSLSSELHRVIFHGALHLCGYKDRSKRDKDKMRKKENKYLSLYGINVSRATVSE
jgi:rRNA maturation RNase YbeY